KLQATSCVLQTYKIHPSEHPRGIHTEGGDDSLRKHNRKPPVPKPAAPQNCSVSEFPRRCSSPDGTARQIHSPSQPMHGYVCCTLWKPSQYAHQPPSDNRSEIGRASCRERV